MHRARSLGPALICLLLAAVLVACRGGSGSGSGPSGEIASFVSPGVDEPIYAVMLTNETTRLVYVTDAQMLHATFRGDNSGTGQPFNFTTENAETIDATPSGDGYSATFTAASGDTFTVMLEPVVHRNAGFYRGRENIRGEDWIIGLIFLNDGKVVGAARSVETGVVERRTSLDLGSKWDDPTTDP